MIFLNAYSLGFLDKCLFFFSLLRGPRIRICEEKKIPDPGLKNVASGQTSILNPAPEIGAQRWFPYPLMEVISDHDKKIHRKNGYKSHIPERYIPSANERQNALFPACTT